MSIENLIWSSPDRDRWLGASWFQKWIQGDHVNRDFLQKISSILKQNIGVQNDRIFGKVWDLAKAARRFDWDSKDPLSAEDFQKIENALRETLLYQGKGIETKVEGSNLQIGRAFQFFLHGKSLPSTGGFCHKTLKGILFKKDPELLEGVRQEFRSVLMACGKQFPVVGSKEEIVYKTFIGNLIALLPYSYPEHGEVFSIPQKIGGEWKNVSYELDRKIELSPKWFSSPFAAYGFTSNEGPPLLVFLGTTYPSGDGYLATLLSDATPFMSVGHAPYLYGKAEIQNWLKDKEKIRVCGTSLGGALSFHVLRNHRDKIAQVDVYNPAGLYPWLWKETYDNAVEVNIIYNEGDLVSTLGAYPEGEGVHVLRPVLSERQNFLKAHAQAYSGNAEVSLLESDPAYENSRVSRKCLTAFHFLVGFLLAFVPVISVYLLYVLFNVLVRHPTNYLLKKI